MAPVPGHSRLSTPLRWWTWPLGGPKTLRECWRKHWAHVRVENDTGVIVQYTAPWSDVLEIDEAVDLGPGQHRLILSLAGTPTVPGFRSYSGEAALSIAAVLTPTVSAQAGLDPVAWARVKALYR